VPADHHQVDVRTISQAILLFTAASVIMRTALIAVLKTYHLAGG